MDMLSRPRRNRSSSAIRDLVAETTLTPANLVLPVFFLDGTKRKEEVSSMPGVYRLSLDLLVDAAMEALSLGIRAFALFPCVDESIKTADAIESFNPDGLNQRCIRLLKSKVPELLLIGDIALDPYNSDGHDGLVRKPVSGDSIVIDNDVTLPVLAKMAIAQARAGVDIVAPSDMMDGRIGYIRRALDAEGFTHVGIISYCAKYASAFYGPFRDALGSTPKKGDKKTYQMDPRNVREALREVRLDEEEGADILMVKPGLPYLDVVKLVRDNSNLPICVYHVSGEYAMLVAAAKNGWLDFERSYMECLYSFRRAGADFIFTYGAMFAARSMQK
eukprot:ANDGO_04784.mRNA.1 Delta-aminolevulinic acid dehydratase